ncbi:DUF397 domain-containing protein [Micromonospora sp. NBC_01813]|uniref:DUF397 domain-containing protein n=1 Tax=Micromonospora sp. NBC_01813 TaxID=2975988 RepID=UPI002DDAA7EB|nr:DUF397 domain-containing protein [Micromonospora sp. NBC_01813]WSA09172.1 DUF397 domain-containing protein [Micromonospora sp. NBC_01813]
MNRQYKSSRSGSSGDCLEARHVGTIAQVRDSKDPAGPVLSFTAEEWVGFVYVIKTGKLRT